MPIEVANLSDHNKALKRELGELKKDRLIWKETHRRAIDLDNLVQRLSDDVDSLQAECSRLRRSNAELESRLEQELNDSADARQRFAEKERELLSLARADRQKLKDLQELQRYEEDEGERTVESEGMDGGYRTEFEKMKSRVSALADANDKKDHQIAELNRVIVVLMRELDSRSSSSSSSSSSTCSEPLSPGGAGINVSADASFTSNSTILDDVDQFDVDAEMDDPQDILDGLYNPGDSAPTSCASLGGELERLGACLTSTNEALAEMSLLDRNLRMYGLKTDGNRKSKKK
ncbi:hypothetical protein HK101_002642, partial [Irineochytrium annulatum]